MANKKCDTCKFRCVCGEQSEFSCKHRNYYYYSPETLAKPEKPANANEKRLIDANALTKYTVEFLDSKCEQIKVDIAFWSDIENAPTVDAVEVVRCKDCKRYSQSGLCNLYLSVSHEMKPDDFCSYGERREGE